MRSVLINNLCLLILVFFGLLTLVSADKIATDYSLKTENSPNETLPSRCLDQKNPTDYSDQTPSYWAEEDQNALVLVMILLPIIMPILVLHCLLELKC